MGIYKMAFHIGQEHVYMIKMKEQQCQWAQHR